MGLLEIWDWLILILQIMQFTKTFIQGNLCCQPSMSLLVLSNELYSYTPNGSQLWFGLEKRIFRASLTGSAHCPGCPLCTGCCLKPPFSIQLGVKAQSPLSKPAKQSFPFFFTNSESCVSGCITTRCWLIWINVDFRWANVDFLSCKTPTH